MSDKEKMTYAASGVDYDAMDPFKRACQLAGRRTAKAMRRFGFSEIEASRGESAYLFRGMHGDVAHVQEGLGTKNVVADAMYALTGKSYYDHIAQDTVAMIVNDLITVGALPVTVAMHLAVGSSDWFDDEPRWRDLVEGWTKACELAGCVWACGETPTLRDIIIPGRVCLDGSATGFILTGRAPFDGARIRAGDAIVLLGSSGIHANGLTLARKIADGLPDGYLTKLSDGRSYGEALLDPTCIYAPFIEECLVRRADIHYAVNITGHGWRKLMRAPQPFAYVIDTTPKPQPVFRCIQEHGGVDTREMYGTFNMGAGFALYVPESDVKKVWDVAHDLVGPERPYDVFWGGHVMESAEKKVIIKPKDLLYAAETLAVR